MISNELVQVPVDEDLKGDSLCHIAKEDEIVALTDGWDVTLLNGRGCRQVSNEHLINP